MNFSDQDGHATISYRVLLLRLWRENNGPWRASLQAVDEAAPRRFADLEALAEFLMTAAFSSREAHAADAGERD